MTLDSLLAIMGLGFAAYQIMPRARQLDLRLRLRRSDLFVLGASIVLVAYLQFYPVFAALGLTPRLGLARYAINPERASFLVLLAAFTLVSLHVRLSPLSRQSLPRLRELVEELLWHDPPQAVLVMEKHLPRIRQFAKSETKWERLLRWAAPTIREKQLELLKFDPNKDASLQRSINSRVQRRVRRLLMYLAVRRSEVQHHRNLAELLLSRLQRSREFAEAVARRRPYFAIRLMEGRDHDTNQFLGYYFAALLSDPTSVLYRELRDNDRRYGPPAFDDGDKLLDFLFSDPQVGYELHIYKPVGDTALATLIALRQNPASDDHNLEADYVFREEGQWSSPLFASVAFFDIMLRSSLYGGIQWHMWLLYYADMTQAMIANYSPRGSATETAPYYRSRYTYLIYEMVTRTRDWILAVHEVRDQAHINRVKVNPEYENENIPKTAIISFTRMFASVLLSNRLPEDFRHAIAHLVFETYFTLRKCGCDDYAEILLLRLHETHYSYMSEPQHRYQAELTQAFSTFDRIPHMMDEMRVGATKTPLSDFRSKLHLNH